MSEEDRPNRRDPADRALRWLRFALATSSISDPGDNVVEINSILWRHGGC